MKLNSIYSMRAFALLGSMSIAAASFGQSLQHLGTLGGTQSIGLRINNAGQVTGYSYLSGDSVQRGFVYSDGAMTALGTFGGTRSLGSDINDLGQVTGYADASFGLQVAVLYTEGIMIDLGSLGGSWGRAGFGINNIGQITGYAYIAGNSAYHAFLYTNQGMLDLGTTGGANSQGFDINNLGQVTGWSNIAGSSAQRAFYYTGQAMLDLGTLGGTTSIGLAINDRGQVTGWSHTEGDSFFSVRAFLYDSGVMKDLGSLYGGSSQSSDINGLGQVVGASDGRAFLYYDGTMLDLNVEYATLLSNGSTPGFTRLTSANGINDVGQITGTGQYFDGTSLRNRAFLLDTRPTRTEPPTADAGPDRAIRAGETVTLDGGASFDDNTPTEALRFDWRFAVMPAGSVATLSGADTVSPSFVADVVGTFIVSLVVTDQDALASEPSLVTIGTENLAPHAIATASPNLIVVGDVVQLDGSASTDPESDPLEFSWSVVSAPAGSAATISNAGTAHATFVPDMGGTYEFRLSVADPLGAGTPVTATIVATTAEGFTSMVVVQAANSVAELPPTMVTTAGNQQAFTAFLAQVLAAVEAGDPQEAINKLQKAMVRTDGWVLRGAPDENGPGRDWITDRDAQLETYAKLKAALDALVGG